MAGARSASAALKITLVAFVCVAVLAICGFSAVRWIGAAGDSGGSGVQAPPAADRQAVAAELARATASQGICYGWQLSDGQRLVSKGSNLGDNVSASTDPGRCSRWVEVRASVVYPPDSSEADDSATVDVVGAPNLNLGGAVDAWLTRFGLTSAAFIDDPGGAICGAARVLPLLVAEAGAAEPAPTPSAGAAAPPRLAGAGSDFWRDRLIFVLVGGALLVVALLMLAIGVVDRRAQRRPRVPAAPPPPPSMPSAPYPPPPPGP